MQVAISYANTMALIDLAGELTSEHLDDVLAAANEALGQAAVQLLRVGCRGITFMDSSGLTVLLEVNKLGEDAGIPLQLYWPTEPVRQVLRVTGLDRFFDIVD